MLSALKKRPSQAEPALKKMSTQAEPALKKLSKQGKNLRTLSLRQQFVYAG
jgi:hypothetical protein